MPESNRLTEEVIPALVDHLVRGREEIRSRHEQGASGIEVTRRLSDLVDRLIASMFSASLERVAAPGGQRAEMTIAATGGYGRRRLAPFSDIDITFIVSEEDDPWLEGVAKGMFFLITSVFTQGAGLKIGYAYRTLRDMNELDSHTQTALLDARLVVGNRALFYRFREDLIRTIRPAVFVCDKLEERHKALNQFGDSVYVVEPNIKMGAGGLRDLHMAEWLAKATMGTGLEDPWGRLRATGLIQEDEFHAIGAGREFMLRLRNSLHWLANKPLDTLTSERQPEVAEQLGYQDTASKSAVEQMMDDYYRHAATVQRISHKVPAKATKHPLRLDPGLVIKNGHITATDVSLMEHDPSAAIRILYLAQQFHFPLSPEVEEMIGDDAARNTTPMDDADSHRLFLQVVRHPAGIYATLRQLADLQVLPRIIPAYGPLLRLLPAEPIHKHTVGEHSLRLVRELESMRDERDPDNVLYRELFDSLDRPEVLILAALLHDIGKVRGSGNHAEIGSGMARDIGLSLGLDEEAVAQLAFLVRHHDLMTSLARSRDPEQPETVAALTSVVGNSEYLASLFLLSSADMRSLGNDTWICVQLEFLARLFRRADRALSQPAAGEPSPETIRSGVNRLQYQLTLRNMPEDTVRAFCQDMPASYLLNTDLDRMVRHIQALDKLKSGAVVHFADERRKPWSVLTVAVPDAPGLLAKISGVLYAHDVNVYAARVFTRHGDRAIALDEMLVDAFNRPLSEAVQCEISRDLSAVLDGSLLLKALLLRRNKDVGPSSCALCVRIRNDVSETFTVVEVDMPDEKGLLFRLASAMARLNWSIHNARIGTRAGEARDVFYVTDPDHHKMEAREADLHAALDDALAKGPLDV